jgi:hypothetical protein
MPGNKPLSSIGENFRSNQAVRRIRRCYRLSRLLRSVTVNTRSIGRLVPLERGRWVQAAKETLRWFTALALRRGSLVAGFSLVRQLVPRRLVRPQVPHPRSNESFAIFSPLLVIVTSLPSSRTSRRTPRSSSPPSAAAPLGRVQGRAEIEKTFKAVFDAYPPRATRAATPIAPQDLLIQEFEGQAIVTFQLGNEGARQRRTFVLRRLKGEWKIVHLHGSAAGGPS